MLQGEDILFNKGKKTPKTDISQEIITENNSDKQAELEEYRRELSEIITGNTERQAWLNRELSRQQSLIAAAIAMEKTAKDKLKAEQDELNRLEEESRTAILSLAEAKQKSDGLTEAYNRELERVKELRTHAERQSAELADQQAQVKLLVDELQQQTFFAGRQAQAMQAIEDGQTENLPPLSELVPPPKEAAQPVVKNHANADFWEKGSQHTNLKLRNPNAEAERAADEAADNAENTPSEMPDTTPVKPPSKLKTTLSYIICILLAVSVALAIRTYVLMPTEVSGSSMYPTLNSADKLLTSPLPYIWGEPQRGDIIVFQAPNEDEGVFYVKRVIGLAGERVLIEDGVVYIDGKPLSEPYLTDTVTDGYVNTVVPSDCVFVLGDNRIVSHDSRADDVACIGYDEIYGKAVWRIAPFDDFGTIY